MNMFLTHSFVKAYFLNDFTYSFRYPELIILVLILDTLLISWLIDKEKMVFWNICSRWSILREKGWS